MQLEVEQLSEINQTYQNTVFQFEKKNTELIGKNKKLESNLEKERIRFQESLDQKNGEKKRSEINNTGNWNKN